jgi:methyl-accepting chemotaxis protein
MKIPRRSLVKGGVIVGAIGALQIAVIFGYLVLTLYPTPEELRVLSTHVVPLFFFFVLLFFVIMVWVGRPILGFLRRVEDTGKRQTFTDEYLLDIQRRAVNYGYWAAAISFVLYIAGAPICMYYGFVLVGWTFEKFHLVFISGFLAGLLNIPFSIYGANIIMKEVIELTLQQSETIPRAARYGLKVSIRQKLIIAFLSIILVASLYSASIGYVNSRQIMDQAKKVEANKEWIKAFEDRLGNLLVLYILIIALAAGLAVFLSYLASQDLNRPIREFLERSRQVAEGNLDQEVTLLSNDELAELAEIFNRMIQEIQGKVHEVSRIMENIRDAIRQLELTSNVIVSVSTEQSAGATQQAAFVSQVSSTSEEIAAMAKQIEEQANRVESMSHKTLSACQEGSERLSISLQGFEKIFLQVQTISSTMQNLEARFQEMLRFIELIESISEQTDLLALNAALEAAGAGDAGRRFSVVAQATRRLANQVAEAASEIREVISAIQKATRDAATAAEHGQVTMHEEKRIIDDTTEAIHKISDHAQDTTSAVKEITISTKQQTSATGQMASSIGEVHQISHQTAEGAQEIDRAVKNLAKLTDSLRKMVENKK